MKRSGFFWVGYSDLMTSLFFIMLVLYVVSFALYQSNISQLRESKQKSEHLLDSLEIQQKLIKIQAEKFKIIESVEKNLEVLKQGKDLFIYEPEFNRYKLSFEVRFQEGMYQINTAGVEDYQSTRQRLKKVASELKLVINKLRNQKATNKAYENISYLIVVSGSASNLPNDNVDDNYLLSYKRAYNLYKFWKNDLGIDFDSPKYHHLLEFQIAGNGIGGVGRFENSSLNDYELERKNQRFLINIIPKIGE